MQNIDSEDKMISFGEALAKQIVFPAVIELVGDVGAGKTTITKGIARGLGITEEITSPTFTLSKRYAFMKNNVEHFLVHYDFYRLQDPGIMSEDLLENQNDKNTVIVIEWGDSVSSLLPDNRRCFCIETNNDGTRTIIEKETRATDNNRTWSHET